MENLRDVKEIKRLLNKAYGKNATPEDRRLAKLIMFSAYGLFGATLPHVPRETTEKGDDNMEQRKFKVGDKVKVNSRESFKPRTGIGEIIHIDDEAMSVPYLVGIKGFNGHSGDGFGGEKIARQKGYNNQCWWCGESELELVEEKEMETVFKLEMGKHIAETKNGNRYLLAKQEGDTIVGLNLDNSTAYVTLSLDENLQDIEDHEFDIKRVYEYGYCGFSSIKGELSDPVWERKEVKEMTMKEICDVLGYEVKIKKED